MSNEINFNVDSLLSSILNKVEAEINKVVAEIADESQKMCPKDTGALRESMEKEVVRDGYTVSAEISYNEAYAERQHEIPAKNYTTSGTSDKYLELPFLYYTDNLKERLEEVLKDV